MNLNSQRAVADPFLHTSAPKKLITLKRRVGYMEQEIGMTRGKLGRMEIDSEKAEISAQTIVPSSSSLD